MYLHCEERKVQQDGQGQKNRNGHTLTPSDPHTLEFRPVPYDVETPTGNN